jgi:hypothetical protein
VKDRDGKETHDHWATPEWLYNQLNEEFNFDFDPCPLHSDFDGLKVEWGERNFINPPYNRVDKPKFIQKAFDEYKKGKICVLLIPVSTSTKQFHELIYPNAEIRFLKSRVKFNNSKSAGKHDSMIVIFKPESLF